MEINQYNMKPLGKNLVVKQEIAPSRSKNGFMINLRNLRQEKPNMGTVISLGKWCDQLEIGDIIKFSKYAGIYFENNDEEYILMAEKEVDVKIPR